MVEESFDDGGEVIPRRETSWPPSERSQGWTRESGFSVFELQNGDDSGFFRDAAAQFSIAGPLISELQINEIFPEPFPGKDDLVQFYLRFNGGSRTPHGCIAHCANPKHGVLRSELDKLRLEGFRSIPLVAEDRMLPFANMLAHQKTMARIYAGIAEPRQFLEEHMAIAFDHTGNDLCISRKTGRVFFMDWRVYKEGALKVAESFRELVAKFWNVTLDRID
jgi:hypothetical protein